MVTHARHFLGLALAAIGAISLTGCADNDVAKDAGATSRHDPTATPLRVAAGPATGDLFLQGTVTREGVPAPGIRVRVMIPIADDSQIKVGQEVPTWESPITTTDAAGHYAISIDPAVLSDGYLADGGDDGDYANFQFALFDGKEMGTWFSTLATVGDRPVWRSPYATPEDSVQDMSVDLETERITVTDSAGETEAGEFDPIEFAPK